MSASTRHDRAREHDERAPITGCRFRSRRTRTARRSPGRVLGRIINRSGPGAQPLIVQTNPLPYMPASLDTSKATLVSRDHESMEGVVTGETPIASADWKFCGGGTFDAPVPLTKLPVQICLKGGFNPAKLYQVVYTAKDPYILGIGFAAWRDVASFFRYAAKDDSGTANPLAGRIYVEHYARPLAIRQLPAEAGCISVSTRTKRSVRCTTACGRSSRAAESRSTTAGRSPMA